MKICNAEYPLESEHNPLFNYWSFSLSNFQKYAIEGTNKGVHVLAAAHTGSGKTLIAEFAILHIASRA